MWLFLGTWLVLAILASWFFSRLKRFEKWMVEEQEKRARAHESLSRIGRRYRMEG